MESTVTKGLICVGQQYQDFGKSYNKDLLKARVLNVKGAVIVRPRLSGTLPFQISLFSVIHTCLCDTSAAPTRLFLLQSLGIKHLNHSFSVSCFCKGAHIRRKKGAVFILEV